ncbi:hypothetical protein RhiLY_11585 [Ceratobasidium sp. AG-Ba]|nr:hypothetical protein RhiLY_11585 [Ceratobasidium sp. AG-Ba]
MGRHHGSSNDRPKTETAHPPNRSARDRPVRNGPSSPTLSPTKAQKADVQQAHVDSGIDKSLGGILPTRSSNPTSSTPKDPDTRPGNNDSSGVRPKEQSNSGSRWLRLVASRISALKGYITPNSKSTSAPDERISVETDHKVEDAPCRNQAKRGRRTYGIRQGASATPVKRALCATRQITAKNDPATGSRVELLESTSDDADWVRACLDKVGFMPEHVKTVQGIGEAPIPEEVFIGELDQLLSAAGDDDVVVIFISMHSIRIQGSGEIFLVLEGKYGCPVHIGTEGMSDAPLRSFSTSVMQEA